MSGCPLLGWLFIRQHLVSTMHILIAHDLTPEADLALLRAAQLARQHDAQLTLLHVQEHEGDTQALQDRLNALNLAKADLRLAKGQPSSAIASQAEGVGATLLVLGAHHKTRPELFAGTTLERLARNCRIPLLLAINRDVSPYRRALVALDFSQCACAALHHTHRLLPTEAELHALNVFEVAPSKAAEQQDELDLQCSLFDRLVADEQARLEAPGRIVQYGVRSGERAACLAEAIREQQPQLLALGKHTRSLMSDALLGGLAQDLLRQPPCDILISRG